MHAPYLLSRERYPTGTVTSRGQLLAMLGCGSHGWGMGGAVAWGWEGAGLRWQVTGCARRLPDWQVVGKSREAAGS